MRTTTIWARALIVPTLIATVGCVASAQTATPQSVATPATSSATAVPVLSAAPSAKPAETKASVRADLGKLDGLAQQSVSTSGNANARPPQVTEIVRRWPRVRSELVGQGANRSDLIATDSAVASLRSTVGGTDVARAANALTAALAPFYPIVGDKVPARVHRLDFLDRAMVLDVAADNWVRANTDAISARSTLRATRAAVANANAGKAGDAYTRALDAVQDAIGARSLPRFHLAIARADRSLERVETAIDTEEPPWRRFLHSVGF